MKIVGVYPLGDKWAVVGPMSSWEMFWYNRGRFGWRAAVHNLLVMWGILNAEDSA